MATAREVRDRLTEAINRHDSEAVGACFSPSAVSEDPFERHEGRGAIVESWRQIFEAFPDLGAKSKRTFEAGDTAIDEWTFNATNTGPLRTPTGESIPATGKRVELRGCDFATVENGVITNHRAYFDQMQLMSQLGLVPEEVGTAL